MMRNFSINFLARLARLVKPATITPRDPLVYA
jgi:hypothetical protein